MGGFSLHMVAGLNLYRDGQPVFHFHFHCIPIRVVGHCTDLRCVAVLQEEVDRALITLR